MRPPHLLISLALLLAVVAATVPSAICISSERRSEAGTGTGTGRSVKTSSLDEYGVPSKKIVEKPKEESPYNEATSTKPSTTHEKPVEEDAESSAPKKVKKEKSDDFDVSEHHKKKEKKEKYEDYANKKEKSDDVDVSEHHKKKEKSEDYANKKEKSDDDVDVSSDHHKKKEKSDDVDVSEHHKKKEKEKEKSDDSGKKKKSKDSDVSEFLNKKKKKKSGDSDEYASPPSKKEKKEKSDELDNDLSSDKKEKKEKAKKKKKKSSDYFAKEKEENPEEDAAPVDVSTDGEYVPPTKEEKSGEDDATPADVVSSSTGQYVPSAPAKKEETFKSSTTTRDAYADASQPMGGAPDEPLPAAAKQSSAAAGTPDAYASPTKQVASQQQQQQPMGGAPDEPLPAAAKISDTYAASSQPVVGGGAPDELPPSATTKPKMSMESFGGMIRKPIAKMLSPVIKRVCARTQYPDDCEASIAALPAGSVPAAQTAAADAIGVLRLAMEAVREKAVEAMNAATDRMNAPGTEATVKEALGDCTASYSDIKSNLETVDDALKRGDLATARTNLDSVETDVTTCDDGFNERGTPSVMTDHDQELQKLASDLIAIGANSIQHT
jgi:pectinesterase inhibitor-like protein